MNHVPDYVSVFVRTPEILKDLPKGWVEIDRDGVRVLCTRTHPGFSGTILSSTLQRPVEVPIFMSRGNSNDSRVVPWTWFFRDYYGQDPQPIDSNHDWRTGATTIALVGGANHINPNATLTAVDAGDEARHVFRVLERHPALGQLAEGIKIPFCGRFEPFQIDGFRPLLEDQDGHGGVFVRSSPTKSVVYGFDPIQSLWWDSRNDREAASSSQNANWISLLIRSITWAAPFISWKGFWPSDIPPLIYSIDTEAGSGYYDPGSRSCVWAVGRRFASRRLDMKTQFSVRTAARRLERRGLIGSFFVDLNAVRDQEDWLALAEIGRDHDISLHMPRIGNHEAWKQLVTNRDATRKALKEAIDVLTHRTGPPVGFRYPSWHRESNTHDSLAIMNLGYDSSSLAHPPFLVVPYRMFSSTSGEPLDLWEFPCVEAIGAVKAGPSPLKGARTRRRLAVEIQRYIETCADFGGLAVLCDHDMALGAARGHVHGTWRLDPHGLRSILRTAQQMTKSSRLRPMRGSEFLRWWTGTRQIRLEPRCERGDGEWKLTIAIRPGGN